MGINDKEKDQTRERNKRIVAELKKRPGNEAPNPMLKRITGLSSPRLKRGCLELKAVKVLKWIPSQLGRDEFVWRWTGVEIPTVTVEPPELKDRKSVKDPRILAERTTRDYGRYKFSIGSEERLKPSDLIPKTARTSVETYKKNICEILKNESGLNITKIIREIRKRFGHMAAPNSVRRALSELVGEKSLERLEASKGYRYRLFRRSPTPP